MTNNYTRTLVKGVIWELTAPLVLFCFTREWRVIVGYTLVRMVMYFAYHRLWKKIQWGKKEKL